MTETQLRQFLEGLLVAWAVDGAVETGRDGDAVRASVRQGGREICDVWRSVEPFGAVWRIAPPDGKARTHASAQGAIRSLGAILAPARPVGRVMFAGGMAGGMAGEG